MRFQSKPPAIPKDLLAQFGEPEHIFAPSVRFRVVAVICGIVVLIMGVLLILLRVAAGPGNLARNDGTRIGAAFLLVLGAAILYGAMTWPRNWVFVCPKGLIRTRGTTWDGIAWSAVERFEDASLNHRGITARQCRLILKQGTEWGFLADHVAEYRRLTDVLKQKINETRLPETRI